MDYTISNFLTFYLFAGMSKLKGTMKETHVSYLYFYIFLCGLLFLIFCISIYEFLKKEQILLQKN